VWRGPSAIIPGGNGGTKDCDVEGSIPQAVTVLSTKKQAQKVPTMRECLIYLSLYELFIILLGQLVYRCSSSSKDLSVVTGSNKFCQDAKMRYFLKLVLLQIGEEMMVLALF
jgi:hypothetical protein